MRVTISPGASADIQRLREFLAAHDERAAQRAVVTILSAARSLSLLPERGRKAMPRGFRELVVPFGKSAYIIRYVYRPRVQEVFVARVWHGREHRD